jgi:hypothetical protein
MLLNPKLVFIAQCCWHKAWPIYTSTNWQLEAVNLNNIYLENNQKIQYIKHSKYREAVTTELYDKRDDFNFPIVNFLYVATFPAAPA